MSFDKIGGGLAKRFDKLLTKADTDKDGKLSRAELADAKKANDKPLFKEAKLDKLFGRLDKDQDGFLTADEFKIRGQGHDKAHKHRGPHTFENQTPPAESPSSPAPTTPPSFFDRLLAKLDLNGDGNITADEIKTVKDQFEAQKAAAAQAVAEASTPEAPQVETTTDTVTTA